MLLEASLVLKAVSAILARNSLEKHFLEIFYYSLLLNTGRDYFAFCIKLE